MSRKRSFFSLLSFYLNKLYWNKLGYPSYVKSFYKIARPLNITVKQKVNCYTHCVSANEMSIG